LYPFVHLNHAFHLLEITTSEFEILGGFKVINNLFKLAERGPLLLKLGVNDILVPLVGELIRLMRVEKFLQAPVEWKVREDTARFIFTLTLFKI